MRVDGIVEFRVERESRLIWCPTLDDLTDTFVVIHKRLGVAEHLDHHKRLALHCVSGIQQTGYGTVGADRPDQIGKPDLSTAHSATRRREDYFGLGANNATYFSIPVGIPGG